MEQQCKISGQSLRNEDVVNENRISELPEAFLLEILSSLPTKNVIATSVLSKSWRSLWKLVPNLKFDSCHHHLAFSKDVYRVLSSPKALFLESLHLGIEDKCDALEIAVLIGIVFMHNVRKLILNINRRKEGTLRFPSVLFSYNNTLEILKLKHLILLDFPSRVCLKSLRELHLHYVVFKDEESVCKLLCGCSSLQDLVIRRTSNIGLKTFTIAVQSLHRLTIEDYCPGEGYGGYLINAPSLEYLNIIGFKRFEFCMIENAQELIEAKIIDVTKITNENILVSLTSAKHLTLYLSPLEYPTGYIFYQLVYLEQGTRKRKCWNLLSLMLDSSPKLKIFKLIDPFLYGRKASQVGSEWDQPKCISECLKLHLETFVWTRYEWHREDEKGVATYILENARRLKKVYFTTKSIKPEELENLEKRGEMLKELACVVRASNSCDIKFESELFLELY